MSRYERTGVRDLTYSKFHRYALGPSAAMIDLDAVDYCPRCRAILAMFELARDTGRAKPVSVLPVLARQLSVRAGVLLYTASALPCLCTPDHVVAWCEHGISSFRVEWLHPEHRWERYDSREFAQRLARLHEHHDIACPRR